MMFRRNEYEILNKMLDDAIAGTFEESCFDESELSKLQSKLKRYLSSASMSERKINEEKNSLKELITNISHQTKTPLTNILMYSELLTEVALGEKEREYANEVYSQGKKLESLIEALVKMSRLETGVFQYEKKETAYQNIINKAVEQARPKALGKNISIIVRDEKKYKASIDEKWVVEAVYNILDNAIKYSDEGTFIYVEEFSYEMFSGIRIEDQGVGILEEEIPLLFGRFYRGKVVHDKEGVGVGLFLAREIVEGNGGYIKVKSEIGKGSTFDVCFPNISTL
ncbi:MAG: sensor histidine kinase [Lachnospiraceae bacterium]